MPRTIPLSKSYTGGTILTLVACLCTLSTFAIPAQAQAQTAVAPAAATHPAPSPVYDVMTIKRDQSDGGSMHIHTGDDLYSATNISLERLLAGIYDIKQDLIFGLSGPIESARFDIEAKISEPDRDALKQMTQGQRRKMLLPLLTERFQLKTHIEIKSLSVFDLVIVHGGPKFKPSADQTKGRDSGISTQGSSTHTTLTANNIPVTALAKSLSGPAHRTVIDKTGLSGNFDFTLQWSNDDNPDAAADTSPSIFTALQEQLGLKLQPAKGPVETLVVDHAAMPSDN